MSRAFANDLSNNVSTLLGNHVISLSFDRSNSVLRVQTHISAPCRDSFAMKLGPKVARNEETSNLLSNKDTFSVGTLALFSLI
jgi:hypothetical protein